jgi:hypothetical protein
MEIQQIGLILQVYNFSYKLAKFTILKQKFLLENNSTLIQRFLIDVNVDFDAIVNDMYSPNYQSWFFFINPHVVGVNNRVCMNYRSSVGAIKFLPEFNYWNGKSGGMSTAKGSKNTPIPVNSLQLMPNFNRNIDFILTI